VLRMRNVYQYVSVGRGYKLSVMVERGQEHGSQFKTFFRQGSFLEVASTSITFLFRFKIFYSKDIQ
jgi:hypothetical protein